VVKSIRKKTFFLILLLLLCTIFYIILFTACNEGAIPSKIIDKDVIVKAFAKDSERFKVVAEYLQNVKEDVYIESMEDNKFSIKKSEDSRIKQFEVADKKTKDDIEYILNKMNYMYIREDGKNGIYFVRQTSLRFAQGIAYSKDSNKPDWGTVEVLEKISGNWYYYKGY
jgi:hypothetical protein